MSLLLDALKQAEKAKQDKASEDAGQGATSLELERPTTGAGARGDERPGPAPESASGLSMAPLDGDAPADAGPSKREEAPPPRAPDYDLEDTGEGAATPSPGREESSSMELDLDALANRLMESTGHHQRRDSTQDLQPPPAAEGADPGTATMPSLKNVQESLREFYDGTGALESPTGAYRTGQGPAAEGTEATGATTRVSHRDASNVFAAKQPAKPKGRKTTWVLLGIVALLLAGAGAGYLYLSSSSLTPIRPPVARGPVAPQPPQVAAPAPTPAAPAPAEPLAAVDAPAPEPAAPASPPAAPPEDELRMAMTPSPGAPEASPAETQRPPEAAEEVPVAAPEAEPAAPRVPPGAAPATPPAPADERPAAPSARPGDSGPLPIRIARNDRQDPVQRRVNQGYRAFRGGDVEAARRAYRSALEQDPRNRDALLGLGASAVAAGRPAQALQVYLRLLALNPKDRVALAALTALQAAADPVKTESRLKLLLDQDPEAAYLHFALGNAYARQSRWAEAQQAYFNAYRVDEGNGDYVFNLAVSLDQMGQRRAALDFYRRALELSEENRVGFDRSAVLRRVQKLSAGSPSAPS